MVDWDGKRSEVVGHVEAAMTGGCARADGESLIPSRTVVEPGMEGSERR